MKRLFIVLVLASLAFSVVCESMPVVRYIEFKVYDPVYVALDKGFFTEEGVKVELVSSILAGPPAIQGVASGSAEAALSSIMAISNAVANKIPIVGVADIQSAIKGQPLEFYFARDDSGITTIKGMIGKRWGINLLKSSFHYTALMAMDAVKMNPSDTTFVTLPFDKQIQAIMQNQIDMASLMEPYASYLRAQPGYHVVFDGSDVFGEKQFSLIFVNSNWAKSHPDIARKFTTAIAKACRWIENNQNEARAIEAKYIGIDPRYVPEYHFQKNGQVNMADVAFWIKYMKSSGDITKPVIASQVATNEYNALVK